MKKIALVLMLPAVTTVAESPCNYDRLITGTYTKQIDRVISVDRSVSDHMNSFRNCRVDITAVVNGETASGQGTFSFGPDITENQACKQAEQRAKENLLARVSPEVITAETKMRCGIDQPNGDRIIALRDLKPYTVHQVPHFVFNPQPAQRSVDESAPKKQEDHWTTFDLLRFGAAILPFLRN